MQIHELTQKKKVNEALSDFFGLNNPRVAQAWSALGSEAIHNLSAKYTKDPRYAKLPLAQRKRAIEQDQYLQRVTDQYTEAWNKQVNELEIRNGAPLNDQQYQTALLNWIDKVWYKGKFGEVDPAVQTRTKSHVAEITKNRNSAEKIKQYFGSLAADQAAREVEVWTTMQQKQPQQAASAAAQEPSLELLKKATVSLQGGPALTPQELQQVNAYRVSKGAPPIPDNIKVGSRLKTGQPSAADYQRLDNLIAQAAKEQS